MHADLIDAQAVGSTVLERLAALPGGVELLDLASARGDVELVGGAVRDLLLDREPRELDIVVGTENSSFSRVAPMLASELASRLNAQAGTNEHERFGTVLVKWDAGQIDIATRRGESYPAPGALPEVRAGTPEEDLQRRDFTINAIAVMLGGPDRGQTRSAEHALEDLNAGRLRVMHDRSFVDDPIRLLRLARYSARLGFSVEPHTASLVQEALTAGALDSVSGARIGAELRLVLAEQDIQGALSELSHLHLLEAVHPRLRLDKRRFDDALGLLPVNDGSPQLLALTSLVLALTMRADGDRSQEARALLARLEFPAGERERVIASALAVPLLIDQLAELGSASQMRTVMLGVPPEGIALAGVLAGASGELRATRWLSELRHIRLEISGDDLLAAGIPPGPEIGRRLDAVLNLRLDGEIPADAQAQLAAALRA